MTYETRLYNGDYSYAPPCTSDELYETGEILADHYVARLESCCKQIADGRALDDVLAALKSESARCVMVERINMSATLEAVADALRAAASEREQVMRWLAAAVREKVSDETIAHYARMLVEVEAAE